MNLLLNRRNLCLKNLDWSKRYLTFLALENGTFTFTGNNVEYSLDNGHSWNTLQSGQSTSTVGSGSLVCWRASGLSPNSSSGIGKFSSTGRFEAMGNIMSMIDGFNFKTLTTISNNYQFGWLFNNATGLRSAENLILPATTISNYCYRSMFAGASNLFYPPRILPAMTVKTESYRAMFYNCTNLTTAPALPATTLAGSCYYQMFYGCTNLTTAPALPATTLADQCYFNLFRGCSSLVESPILPATTLVNKCYHRMFYDCSSLSKVTCLATNVSSGNSYYQEWLYGVAPEGIFLCNNSVSWPTNSSTGIPSGWTDTILVEKKLLINENTFRLVSAVSWTATATSGITLSLSSGNAGIYTIQVTIDGSDYYRGSITFSYGEGETYSIEVIRRTLPEGYQRVDHISSTSSGKQYIDLGLMMWNISPVSYDIKIKFNIKKVGDGNDTFFNAYNEGNSQYPGMLIRSPNATQVVYKNTVNSSTNNKILGKVGNIIETEISESGNVSATHSLSTTLFAGKDGSGNLWRYCEADLYYLYINSYGTEHYYLPYLNSSGIPGLYDIINDVFYSSRSSTPFDYTSL